MGSRTYLLLLTCLLTTGAAATRAQDGGDAKGTELRVRVLPGHESLQPGQSSRIAIELRVDPHWHLYYPILLSAGLPTEVTFDAPPELKLGPVRFPRPTLAEFQQVEYLGYEEKATLLADIAAAADAKPGSIVTLKVAVSGLACKESCIPVSAEAELQIRISAEPGKPANDDVIEAARRELLPPLDKAPYLEGSRLLASHTKVPVGGSGELVAVLNVKRRHHIQDPDPGVEGFIGSRLFIESVDGLTLKDPSWPRPRDKTVPGIGKVREQSGEVVVRIPFTIADQKFEPRPLRLRTLLQYQVCKDEGECYPPEMAEGFFEFEVIAAGAAGATNNDPLLAKLGAPAATGDSPAAPAAATSSGSAPAGPAAKPPLSLFVVFVFALLGGVILNVMPCVLPVISLKIFSFMQQAGENPGRVLRMGLVYAGGILASFAVLAAVMVVLDIPWGGLMQRADYVIAMSAVVFAFALSLLGVFELKLPGVVENVAGAVTTREGYGGAFLNGLMATALATPCVGPFLGTAMGILVQLPPAVRAAGIMTVGVGLALPYVLLSAFPGWLKFMPRPGNWMIVVKQIMGFVLLATVVWLLWVLAALVSPEQLVATLAFLVAVGFACWLVGRLTFSSTHAQTYVTWAGAAAALVAGWFVSFGWLGGGSLGDGAAPAKNVQVVEAGPGAVTWLPWRKGLAEDLAAKGYTVYVDFTAKWCLTCQTNKKVVLQTDPIVEKFRAQNVVALLADFTRPNPDIKSELRKYDRAGVPLNIVVPAGRPQDVIVLPEILTQSIVLEALEKAGPSTNHEKYGPAFASRGASEAAPSAAP
jgi:thiol:disulfide interchange protein DsbD